MANNYYNFPTPFVAGTKVRSDQVNSEYAGVESGFDLLPTTPSDVITGKAWFGVDVQGATVNEYLITTPDPLTTLENGQRVSFFATHTNTGPVTVNVDSTGLVAGVSFDGSVLGASSLSSGRWYELVYDNPNTQWLLQPGAAFTGSITDLVVTESNVIDLVDTDVAVNIGSLTPISAQHLEMDPTSLQSKSNATTAAVLFLNPVGGNVNIAADLVIAGLVDGRDVALDGSTQDTHIADATIHFTEGSIDHTAILNIGVNSHAAIDTHIADATIHFTEGSIDHTAILNIGTNSHAQIDTHIADATLHFTEGSIDHTAITNIGVNSHAQIDTHIADATLHFTEASIDHTAISNIGTNSHAAIDTHIADATIHFTQAAISITESQISDLQAYLLPADQITVLDATADRMFYSDNAGNVSEITLGTAAQVLTSNGLTSAPSFQAAAGGGSTIIVEDEGGVVAGGPHSTLDFVGAGVVASDAGGGTSTITISGGGSGITVEDEGVPLATLATTLDFVGAGVVASGAGATKTITIAGGGGGDVTKVGTPIDNEIGVWTGDGTLEGDTNLTWDGSLLTVAGDLTVTGTVLKLGTGTDNFLIRHGGPDGLGAGLITISGGTGTSDGAHIQLFGEFHATQRNDMLFRVSTNAWMIWDESEGDLEMLTGTGSKLAALTLTNSQDAVFNRTVEIGEEILFTERADHVFTPVATRGILWLRNDAPNKLIFTDDAGTDFDLTDTGIGAFTEDGTNNSIFSAGAGTALLAGGIHNFLALDGAGVLITTGDRNIAIGDGAGGALVTDSDNVMIGSLAGENLTAANNTFVGAFSGRSVTTSPRNTAVGTLALGNTSAALVTPAADNTAIGYASMSNFALGEAGQNTALGASTLNFLTTGDENVAIGYNAGGNITTGTGNVMLGHTAGPTANQSDRLYIHNGNSDTPLIGGDFAASTLQINGTLEITAFNENEATFTGAAGTKNLDTSAATYFRASASMAGNAITFTFDNPPVTGRVATITLEFTAASTATLTFPASVQFPGGTQPSWSVGTDIVSFTTSDGGTTWNGFLGGLDFS